MTEGGIEANVGAKFINPFFVFSWVVAVIFILYSAGYSQLYPELTIPVVVFFIFVVLSSLCLVFFGYQSSRIDFQASVVAPSTREVSIVVLLWLLSFIYNRGIPLLQVATGDLSYDIYGFGIPFLQVALLTSTSVLSLRGLAVYLKARSWSSLAVFLIFPIFAVLIYSRSAISFFFVSSAVIYISLVRVTAKKVIVGILAFGISASAFALLGNERLKFQVEQVGSVASDFDNLLILFSEPTSAFYDSGLPLSSMWVYLYASSPVANFQNMVNKAPGDEGTLAGFIVSQLVPDVLGKRLVDQDDEKFPREDFLVSQSLTVGTTFFGPYYYMGWRGVALMWSVIVGLWVSLMLLCRHWEWRIILSATFCSFLVFSMFDNMLRYSACSIQIFIPVIFSYLFSGSSFRVRKFHY